MPRVASHPLLPSVTEIIAGVGLSRSYAGVDPKYAQRGRALHEVIAMALDGLEVPDLPPELQGGYAAFLEFQAATGFVVEATEETLVHEPYGFVGTLDARGLVNGVRAICDWKFTESVDAGGARIQLAGYGILDAHRWPEAPAERRYVVQLSKGGHHKLLDVTDEYSTQVFLASLIVFKAKEKR